MHASIWNDERISTTTVHVQDGRLRIDEVDADGERSALIFDRTRLYNVQVDRRDYSVVDADVLERMQRLPDPTRSLRDYVIAEAPADQRLQVAQAVHGGSVTSLLVPSDPVTVRPLPVPTPPGPTGVNLMKCAQPPP